MKRKSITLAIAMAISFMTGITYAQPVAYFTTPDTMICHGELIQFTDSSTGGIVSWDWYFTCSSLWHWTTPTPPLVQFHCNGPVSVELTVTDTNNQTSTMTMFLYVMPTYQVQLFPQNIPNNLCEGDTVHFNAQAAGIGNWYTWIHDVDTVQQGVSNLLDATEEGYYTVVVTNMYGCTDSQDEYINMTAVPVTTMWATNISTGQSSYQDTTTFCPPLNVQFSVSSFNTGIQYYTWPDGSHNPYYQTTTPGTHAVTVASYNGCSVTDSLTIDAYPQSYPVINVSPGQSPFCETDTVHISVSGGPFYLYNWNVYTVPGGFMYYNSPIIQPAATGAQNYNITVYDANACPSVATTVSIEIFESPDPPTITQFGCALACSPEYTYQWYFNGVKIDGETSQILTQLDSGFYSVMTTNIYGCTAMSSMLGVDCLTTGVAVHGNSSSFIVYPNPVRPNGSLVVIMAGNSATQVTIYDMSGRIVKEAEGQREVHISQTDLSPGMYLVSAMSGGKKFNKKIVVQ